MIALTRKNSPWIALGIVFFLVLGFRMFLYRPRVDVVAAEAAVIEGKIHGPGTVQSRVSVTVSTKITGVIQELYADQGDTVHKGQLLAQLDAAELDARRSTAQAGKDRAARDLARAGADLARARANLTMAQGNYDRDLEVFRAGYISRAALDASKAAKEIAQSEVSAGQAAAKALQSGLEQAGSEARAADALLGYARVYAPMTGLITGRKVEAGSTVSPGTPLFVLVDPEKVWAASWIDQTRIAGLRTGQKASIRLRSGRTFPGVVVRVAREADSVTRELEVDVLFSTIPEPLVIGEETEVEIHTGARSTLAVPLTALIERDGSQGVLVIAGGRTQFRKIVPGVHDDRMIEVAGGIAQGDLVVSNPSGIRPGKRVRHRLITGGR